MALSLDDKLLGEKLDYYCSSSEDECDDDDDADSEVPSKERDAKFIPEPELKKYSGRSTNTGPKGVIKDWQRFKQLEIEKQEENELERMQLAKKLSLTCRSHLDDEKEAGKDEEFMQMIDELEDEFIKQYREKRIEEMRQIMNNRPQFKKVLPLSKGDFINAIDHEKPQVTIIVHVYEDGAPGCKAMNGCLQCLALEYPEVKFCMIKAKDILSAKFSKIGVPALLVYKKGELIGNYIRLTDEFGNDFFATDVQSFLVEHGMLTDKSLVPQYIRETVQKPDDSDSDFDVD